MSSSVGLVIPAYRPDPTLLREYVDAVRRAVDPAVVRIELDAPTEETLSALEGIEATVSTSAARRGKGLAVSAGFDAMDEDVLAFVDADGSTAAASVGTIVDRARSGGADVAVGTRRHPDADVARSATPGRRVLGDGLVALARTVTGLALSDFQCGAKAVTADCWRDVRGRLYETGFGWDLELLWVAARAGYELAEVPVTWRDRPGSTVPPIRTSAGLAVLLGRIGLARIRGRPTARAGGRSIATRLGGD